MHARVENIRAEVVARQARSEAGRQAGKASEGAVQNNRRKGFIEQSIFVRRRRRGMMVTLRLLANKAGSRAVHPRRTTCQRNQCLPSTAGGLSVSTSLAAPRRTLSLRRSSLLCLENTQNLCGARAIGPERMKAMCAAARDSGLKVHVDGEVGGRVVPVDRKTGREERQRRREREGERSRDAGRQARRQARREADRQARAHTHRGRRVEVAGECFSLLCVSKCCLLLCVSKCCFVFVDLSRSI